VNESPPGRQIPTRIPTRWIVRRSRFPFGTPGAQLGEPIEAPTRQAAQQLGEQLHGGAITVEPYHDLTLLEHAVAKAELSAAKRQRGGYGGARFGRNRMTNHRDEP
jgi:hypothetical protein